MIHQIRAIHWNSKLLASIRRVQLFENRNALTLRLDYISALSEPRIKRKVIPVQACSRPHPHLFQCGGSASALPIALRRRIDWNNRMRDRFRSNYRVTSTKVWRTEGPYSPVGGCHRASHYRYRLNRGSFPLVTNAMTFADRRCLRRWGPTSPAGILVPIADSMCNSKANSPTDLADTGINIRTRTGRSSSSQQIGLEKKFSFISTCEIFARLRLSHIARCSDSHLAIDHVRSTKVGFADTTSLQPTRPE